MELHFEAHALARGVAAHEFHVDALERVPGGFEGVVHARLDQAGAVEVAQDPGIPRGEVVGLEHDAIAQRVVHHGRRVFGARVAPVQQHAQLVVQGALRLDAVRLAAQGADAFDGRFDDRRDLRLDQAGRRVQRAGAMPELGFGFHGRGAQGRRALDRTVREQLLDRHLHESGREGGVVAQPLQRGLRVEAPLTQLLHHAAPGVRHEPDALGAAAQRSLEMIGDVEEQIGLRHGLGGVGADFHAEREQVVQGFQGRARYVAGLPDGRVVQRGRLGQWVRLLGGRGGQDRGRVRQAGPGVVRHQGREAFARRRG